MLFEALFILLQVGGIHWSTVSHDHGYIATLTNQILHALELFDSASGQECEQLLGLSWVWRLSVHVSP